MENTYRVVKVTEPNYGSSKLQTNYQIDKFDKGIKFFGIRTYPDKWRRRGYYSPCDVWIPVKFDSEEEARQEIRNLIKVEEGTKEEVLS